MKRTADEAGSIESGGKWRQRVQIRTINQLLAGYKIDLPPVYDIISANAAARRANAQRPAKVPTPAEIREQPPFKLPLLGGRKAKQNNLPLDEPLLTTQVERPARSRRQKSA